MLHYYAPLVAALTLITVPSFSRAQTLPPTNAPTQSGAPVDQLQPLSEQSITQMLQSLDVKYEVKNGTTGNFWNVQIQHQDGWKFLIEMHAVRSNGKMSGYTLVSPLGQPLAGQQSADQLQKLLEANVSNCPISFGVRQKQICAILDAPFMNVSAKSLNSDFTFLASRIKATVGLWNIGAVAAAAVAPKVMPAPAVNPAVPNAAPVAAKGLIGTTWIGNETLETYGRLEFRFQANGQVQMIDAAGTTPGTFTQQGNTVTLSFFNDSVIYTGTLNGQTIAGSASNSKITWNFTVSR